MIPSSSVKTLAALGWILVYAASVAAEEKLYAKVGGDVTLKPKPGSVTDATTGITWKVGVDLAAELEDGFLQYYRDFKGRSELNNLTGDFTIKNLNSSDTHVYTIEISNFLPHHKIDLRVISPVPAPTIGPSCSEDKDAPKACTLTCEGDTTGAEPVEYSWMSDDTEVPDHPERTYTVEQESSDFRKLSCKMKNPLGEKISKPFFNNFNTEQAEGGPKISTGITVAIILLVVVILVVIVHRLKTGEWFFNKNSMPWEGDFWRNNNGQQPQAAVLESNGATSTLREKEEETAFNE